MKTKPKQNIKDNTVSIIVKINGKKTRKITADHELELEDKVETRITNRLKRNGYKPFKVEDLFDPWGQFVDRKISYGYPTGTGISVIGELDIEFEKPGGDN